MKLAFISDIHANLPALHAVLKDMERHKPDAIYCLGDLVNFAGWDNDVIALLRARNIPVVIGNHDEGIGQHKSYFPFSYSNEQEHAFGIASIGHVNKIISTANREYLRTLPFMLKLEFRCAFQPVRIVMTHGSISSVNEYVTGEADEAYLLKMMESCQADILLMGHTHIPYQRSIFCEEENRQLYRHAINAGSVGKPKHGDNNACYVLLDINSVTSLNDPSTVRAVFKYVPYNVWNVIKRIEKLGLPDAYTTFLLNGQ